MTDFEWKNGATGFITVRGKRLEVASYGPAPGKAPTIIMLHEGLGCVALWRDFPRLLSDATGWGVFVWSREGYGQSDFSDLPRPPDYMTKEACEALPEVLELIGFRYGLLLGHSDGASITAIYGGSVEDFRVRGLVLIAPHFFTEPMGLASIAEAKTLFETGDLQQKMAKYHRDAAHTFRGWNEAWLDPGFQSWYISGVIDYLRVPVLAIQGESDQYGTMAQIKAIEEGSYAPVDVEVIAGYQHSPHLEKPELTLAAIKEFCERLWRIEQASP